MMEVQAADPSTGTLYNFADDASLNDALNHGYIAIRPDGSSHYVTQQFQGGWIMDGAPLNCYIEGTWWDGQKALLQPYWTAGTIPTPSAAILALPSAPMPADVAANWNLFQQSSNSGLFGLSTPVLIGGAIVLALMLKK